MLLLLMSPDRQFQIEAHKVHHDRGFDCTSGVSHRFEHHTAWYRHRIVAGFVTSSEPLKTRRVGSDARFCRLKRPPVGVVW
ncbi:hypothetical protein TNCV_4945671 [Trichonephila clavipes]|nr:hypothetical protein TNCV_4945671 [Trichonephila clavipes]